MPWSIHERDGKFCVVKDTDGSVVHCHETREKALSQQRALYANEPTVNASLELDTSALMEEFYIESGQPPVRIEVGPAPTEANEALVAALRALSERLIQTEERQAEIIEALHALSTVITQDREQLTASLNSLTASFVIPEPVVNVTVPEPVVNVSPPQVHVTVEAPEQKKKVVVERDPLTGLIASAEVVDGG